MPALSALLELFLRLLYVGLFTVGGGLATIPLMLQMIVAPGYVTEDFFYNMVAISESTPGPIGVNIATYIGYTQYGAIGAIICTLGIIIPCFIITYLVSKAFEKFSETKAVKASLYGIRAAVAGLIATAVYGVLKISVLTLNVFNDTGSLLDLINWKAFALFAALFILLIKTKKHPIIYIALGGIAGFFLL